MKIILLTFFVTTVLTFGSVAFANETTDITYDNGILHQIDNTNEYIYSTIDRTQNVTGGLLLNPNSGVSIDVLSGNLITSTDRKVAGLIDRAAKKGVQISQEYIEVQIGNSTLLVDPCYCF